MVQDLTYSVIMLYPKDSAAPSHYETKIVDAFKSGLHNILYFLSCLPNKRVTYLTHYREAVSLQVTSECW